MSCEYCNLVAYLGEPLPFEKHIDGKHQYIEVCITRQSLFEGEELPIINIDGTHTDIDILINYCPKCGEKL